MSIKRGINTISDRLSNKIDLNLLNYVSRYIDDNMDILEKAFSIYLCLGDVLCYSPYFCLNHDYSRTNIVGHISLINNEIICKNWSLLYKRLLKYFGIKAKISRVDSHYMVEMILDGVIYSMDATTYGGPSYFYSMSDTTRIKCNFKVERFLIAGTLDPYDNKLYIEAMNNLDMIMDKVYKKQGRVIISEKKLERLKYNVVNSIYRHAERVGIGSLEDLNYRIKVINRFWGMNITVSPVERIQLFNSYFKTIFSDLDDIGYKTKSYNIYSFKNNKLFIYKLIAVEVDGNYFYYFEDGNKFEYYTKKELAEEFSKRNIRITEFTEIMGMLVESFGYKVKMK